MYVILAILAIVNILLISFTKNIFSAIIAHGTFNTGVILLSIDPTLFFFLIAISLIVALFYYFSPKRSSA
jgi:voltage-gated potassium channel Kch